MPDERRGRRVRPRRPFVDNPDGAVRRTAAAGSPPRARTPREPDDHGAPDPGAGAASPSSAACSTSRSATSSSSTEWLEPCSRRQEPHPSITQEVTRRGPLGAVALIGIGDRAHRSTGAGLRTPAEDPVPAKLGRVGQHVGHAYYWDEGIGRVRRRPGREAAVLARPGLRPEDHRRRGQRHRARSCGRVGSACARCRTASSAATRSASSSARSRSCSSSSSRRAVTRGLPDPPRHHRHARASARS